jgi:hypothetical protein
MYSSKFISYNAEQFQKLLNDKKSEDSFIY